MEQWQHRVSLTPETLRSHGVGTSGAGSLAKGSSSAAGHITSFRNLSEPLQMPSLLMRRKS